MGIQFAADIGERGLLRRLRDSFPQQDFIGDDCSISGPLQCPIVTTDSYFEGSHFYRWWADGDILGRRVLEASLSDIAAMGGDPVCAMAAITVPPQLEVDWIIEFYRGLTQRDDCPVAGGETIRGDVFGITLTVLGEGGDSATLLRRDALKPGDRLWLSGAVGRSLGAPLILDSVGGLTGGELVPLNGELGPEQLQQVRSFLRPRAELQLGARVRELGVRCGIDISDGLLSESAHLASASGVDVTVEIDEGFIHSAVRNRPLAASSAGEDFVLLLGASRDIDLSGESCVSVGFAERGKGHLRVLLGGKPVKTEQTGFDHLKG